PGLEGERDGEGQSLLLPERERHRWAIQNPVESIERCATEDGGAERIWIADLVAKVARPEEELVSDGPREEHLAGALEDVPKDAGQVGHGSIRRWMAVDRDGSLAGSEE